MVPSPEKITFYIVHRIKSKENNYWINLTLNYLILLCCACCMASLNVCGALNLEPLEYSSSIWQNMVLLRLKYMCRIHNNAIHFFMTVINLPTIHKYPSVTYKELFTFKLKKKSFYIEYLVMISFLNSSIFIKSIHILSKQLL